MVGISPCASNREIKMKHKIGQMAFNLVGTAEAGAGRGGGRHLPLW